MVRVEVIGPQERLPAALAFLQAHAVLELRTPAEAGVTLRPPAGPDVQEEARLAEALRAIEALRLRLPPGPDGPPRPLPAPGTEPFAARLAALDEELGVLEARRSAIAQEREATEAFAQLVVALAPLGHALDPALEPELHGLLLHDDGQALALLRGEVRRITAGVGEVKARPLDGKTTGVLVVVPRAHGRALAELLRERGVTELPLPSHYTGKRLVDVLLMLAARERALPGELAAATAAIAAFAAGVRVPLEASRRAAEWEQERRGAMARCGATRFAFVVCGYMPAERVPGFRVAAAAELGDRVAIFARPIDRSEWGDVPVVLRSRPWVRPFELLLTLVPLPRYGSIDPLPWLAVFFPLFFGLVLGDLAFGVLGVALSLLARRRGWGGPIGRDLAGVALACSVSAAVFGLLYGEALGALGSQAGLRPLLLDRRTSFMSFLALALGLGGLHLVVGMALGVLTAARSGRLCQAVGHAAKLVLVAAAAAAACALLGLLPRGALTPVLVVGAVFAGVALLAEGPLIALDLVLALGNVLSYARLMALGLASVMLAEVANLVAGRLDPAAAGVALGVLLHAVNFTLGLIGPTIAALRLHYVEFFDKFYVEGGFPFRPFGLSPRHHPGPAR